MAKKMFKNLTLTQKTILYLKEKGAEESGSKGKYRMFFDNTDNKYYFVGKAGAVRTNSKPAVSKSMSVTHQSKPAVNAWAEKQEQKVLTELP